MQGLGSRSASGMHIDVGDLVIILGQKRRTSSGKEGDCKLAVCAHKRETSLDQWGLLPGLQIFQYGEQFTKVRNVKMLYLKKYGTQAYYSPGMQ
jgi:hypothetical protein